AGDTQKRLTAKDNRPLGDSPQIAGKAQLGQALKPIGGHAFKNRMSAKIIDLLRREMQMLKIVNGLLQAGAHQVVTALGETPNPQRERDPLIRHAVNEITGGHGQLIQVGEQTQTFRIGKERMNHHESGVRIRLEYEQVATGRISPQRSTELKATDWQEKKKARSRKMDGPLGH